MLVFENLYSSSYQLAFLCTLQMRRNSSLLLDLLILYWDAEDIVRFAPEGRDLAREGDGGRKLTVQARVDQHHPRSGILGRLDGWDGLDRRGRPSCAVAHREEPETKAPGRSRPL